MSLWDRLKRKPQRALPASQPEADRGDLREFVYIDDVSVQSLLASRTGAIATDYTDSETSGTTRTREANAGLSHGPVDLGGRANREESVGATSQVVRQSNAQARFKQLRDAELEGLLLRVTPPESSSGMADSPLGPQVVPSFEHMRERHQSHVLPEVDIRRGDLFELDIELEAEPIFGVSAAMASLVALFEQAPQLVSRDDRDVIQKFGALPKMFDELLTGLVPVRGRAVDYQILRRRDGDYVIHNSLLAQLPEEDRGAVIPLVIVGVVEQELFWKDLRRVLFAGHRYTVLARVAVDGLPCSWQPIKLVDLVAPVSPELALMLSSASTQAVASLGGGTELASGDGGRTQGQRALDEYRDLLAEKLGIELVEAARRCQDITNVEGSADREGFREAAQAVTDRLTAMREEGIPPTQLSTLRNEAWSRSQQRDEPEHQPELRVPVSGASERYLNAEFVAIYW